jgi:hypothetical protein
MSRMCEKGPVRGAEGAGGGPGRGWQVLLAAGILGVSVPRSKVGESTSGQEL